MPRARSLISAKSGSAIVAGSLSDELDQRHLGRVRLARAELQDACVAARALRVARRDLLEKLVDHELVLAELGQRLAAGVQVAAPRERDQLLDLGLDRLRLRDGRLDPLVLDQLLREVREQRLAVRRVARELVPVALVAHRPNPTRRAAPGRAT